MENKLLYLKLRYKGKDLDRVEQMREFKSTFAIGSDAHYLWQILDKTFPQRHQLITTEGGRYCLNLLKGMNLTVSRNEQALNLEDLRRSGLLKGDKLVLDGTHKGSIAFANDYEIEYYFDRPRARQLSPEQQQILKIYGKHEELDRVDKFIVRTISITFFVSLVILFVLYNFFGEIINPPKNDIRQLAEKQGLIKIEHIKTNVGSVAQPEKAEEETPEEAPEASIQGVTGGTGKKAIDVAKMFGDLSGVKAQAGSGSSNTGMVRNNQLVAMVRHGGGSGGGGFGPGVGGAGSGGGAGDLRTTSGEMSNISSYKGQSLAGVSISSIGQAGPSGARISNQLANTLPKGELTTLGQIKAQFQNAQRSLGSGAQQISGRTVSFKPSDVEARGGSDQDMMDAYFSNRQERLFKIFRTMAFKYDTFGTISFVLAVKPGQVIGVDITPGPASSFNDEIIAKFRAEILTWRPNVKSNATYRKTLNFAK